MTRRPDPFIEAHIARVNAIADPSSATMSIADWIIAKTFIKGEPFSFKDHEYQKFLLSLEAQVIFVQKPSQIGISELQVRWLLGFLNLHRGVNAIYILPTAKFAEKFSQTRVSPVIQGSPHLSADLRPDLDSAAVKRFMNDSLAFFQGASKSSQAISVPCDLLVGDELNFMEDQAVVTSYASRLTHSDFALERYFSTPTFKAYGVSLGLSKAKRHVELQKCQRCGHWFQPDYFSDIVLPGFSNSLHEITYQTRSILDDPKVLVDEAYLACPKCKGKVDQHVSNRQFVTENTDSTSDIVGVALTPFCAPRHMPPPKMIRTATKYKNKSDFYNFCLGLPYDDESSGLTREELELLFRPDVRYPEHPPMQVSGTDMGGTCAHMEGFPAPDGHLRITKAALIPLHRLREDFPVSLGNGRVISSVMDGMPYTDLVAALQANCPTLWAALKSDAKSMELYHIREQEEDESKATYGLRQVNFKRNALYDYMVMLIRGGGISFAPSAASEMETIIAHLTDMKRVKVLNKFGEEEWNWVKSPEGTDHYFHALSFLILANFLKGLAGGMVSTPFLVTRLRIKNTP